MQEAEQTPEAKKSLKEIIQNTGRKVKEIGRNISNCWDWYDMNAKCIYAGVILVVAGGIGVGSHLITRPFSLKEEFDKIYIQKLWQYGNPDGNNVISMAERDEFDRLFLSDKEGVTLVSNGTPKYKDGKNVPTEVLIEWLKNYNPKK